MTPKKIGRKVRVAFQAAPPLAAWLQDRAIMEGLTLSEMVERLLWAEWVRERGRGTTGKERTRA